MGATTHSGTCTASSPKGGASLRQWAHKESRRTGNEKIRTRDLLLVLWSIYQENEGAIPDAVWDARQELEREIMALPESAL